MAKVITFDGKQIIEPGAYSRITGGETDPPDVATFGNALLIDTGSMAKFGYGSGITGSIKSGSKSIYAFKSIDDFKLAVGGSIVWDAAKWLFKPSKSLSIKGIDTLYLVHARTTTKSSLKLDIKNGGTRATGNIVFVTNPANNDTITMNGIVFTFKTVATLAADVQIASTLKETLVNAAEKLNSSTNVAINVAQYTSTSTQITVKYKAAGVAGNAYTLVASVGVPSGATLTGGVNGALTNGGAFAVNAIVEGLGANGNTDPDSSELYNGFALKLVAGIVDTAKYAVEFYRGQFHGLDWNSTPFDNISRADSSPLLLTKSIEFSVLQELFDWADTNDEFKSWFERDKANCSITGTGALITGDVTTLSGYNFFTQGTESYSAGDLTKVYEYIKELDYSFMLSDKYETDDDDTINYQHISHINLQSEFKRTLMIGGGADSTQFTAVGGTVPVAATFDDENIHIMHSRVYKNFDSGQREYPTLYFAAAFLGRAAGASPQVPMTWKDLDFDGVKHELSKTEREICVQKGVTHLRFVESLGLVINLDNNTKQKNTQDVYEDGSSPYGSIVRIKNLLNRELSKSLRVKFVGQNANTAAPADVKAYAESRLALRTATKTEDNLILSFKNVKASLVGSDYDIKYSFTPNSPINRMFVTGFMFNVNSNV